MQASFGLKDYWSMCKAKGLKLPLHYFLENHLFDIRYRVNTHERLFKEDFDNSILNLEHGVLYMCSWTSVIKESTRFVLEHSGLCSTDFTFLDIGCGKGKVLCVWAKMFNDNLDITGVDYSSELLSLCQNNLDKIDVSHIQLKQCDATKYKFVSDQKCTLVYMYNPFDDFILKQVLNNLPDSNVYVIYNNPVHDETIIKSGFDRIRQVSKWHPNANYNVYKR